VHLWPGAEVIEVIDDAGDRVPLGDVGEIVWTPIGWHGSVILRLRTGVRGRIDTTRCATCGAGETLIPVEPVRPQATTNAAAPEPRARRGLSSLADIARGKRRG
jgi:phenylacetate-coenzyme A ligase PaaK-like adenylate-forming protein